MDEDDEPSEKPASKVARLTDEYELGEEFGARMESLWTSPDDERKSLRELANYFNQELLAATLRNAGVSTVDGELANLYRLLTDDEASSGARTEARARLEGKGVDVEALESDFVTYQAIRTYLIEYRGAEYESAMSDKRIESAVNTIQRLQSRVESVVEGILERFRTAEEITLGDFYLFVSVDVFCGAVAASIASSIYFAAADVIANLRPKHRNNTTSSVIPDVQSERLG